MAEKKGFAYRAKMLLAALGFAMAMSPNDALANEDPSEKVNNDNKIKVESTVQNENPAPWVISKDKQPEVMAKTLQASIDARELAKLRQKQILERRGFKNDAKKIEEKWNEIDEGRE